MESLRVALITPSIYPIQRAGTEVAAYHLMRNLESRGNEVVCLAEKHASDAPAPMNPRVRLFGSGHRRLGPFLFLVAVTWELLLMRKGVDVVDVHNADYYGIPACTLRLLWGTPYVVICQGSDVNRPYYNRIITQMQRIILSRASVVGVQSNAMGAVVKAMYGVPEGKMTVLNTVVDADEIEAISREPKVRSDVKKIAFIGVLKQVKDPMTAVKAFKILQEKMDRVELIVMGDGPLRQKVAAYVKENELDGRVVLKGFVEHEEALRILHGCDAVVISSTVEGSPTVLTEALYLGVPVVATKVGGMRDVITMGVEGILVPPSEPEKMAEALHSVLADPRLSETLVRNARRRAENMTWKHRVVTFEEIYRSAIHRTEPPGPRPMSGSDQMQI